MSERDTEMADALALRAIQRMDEIVTQLENTFDEGSVCDIYLIVDDARAVSEYLKDIREHLNNHG